MLIFTVVAAMAACIVLPDTRTDTSMILISSMTFMVTVQAYVRNPIKKDKPQSSQRKFTQSSQRKWKISAYLKPDDHKHGN